MRVSKAKALVTTLESQIPHAHDMGQGTRPMKAMDIQVEKYDGSRFWAVSINGELLAVVCYKKGATAIKESLLLSLKGKGNEILPLCKEINGRRRTSATVYRCSACGTQAVCEEGKTSRRS